MTIRTVRNQTQVHPRWLAVALKVLLAATGLLGAGTLILEYGGFDLIDAHLQILHIIQSVVVGIFAFDRLLRFILVSSWQAYLRENWLDLFLLMALGVALAVSYRSRSGVMAAGALFVFITQAYILAMLIIHGLAANVQMAGSGIHPGWLLLGSFAFLCLAGAGLLMLPVSTPQGRDISFLDSLFTATSATCVTGLVVNDIGQDFTKIGQAVVLSLIQLGGLGIMIFGTMLAILVGKSLTLRGTNVMGEIMPSHRGYAMRRVIFFAVASTIFLEAVGTVLMYPMFRSSLDSLGKPIDHAGAIWYGWFHSISAFCNAGLSLYTDNLMQGVRTGWAKPLREHWQILGVIAPLIVLGGLGFPTLMDCVNYLVNRVQRVLSAITSVSRPPLLKWPLHSRIVLVSTAILIVGGAAGIFLFEMSAGQNPEPMGQNPSGNTQGTLESDQASAGTISWIEAAVFHSISARTAGFNTVDISKLSTSSKLWLVGLMLIGGSPAGTAGGMKTLTAVILLLATFSVICRRREIELFHRSLSLEVLRRVVAIAVLYLTLVVITTLALTVAMGDGYNFMDVFFEAVSACGTVGLSTGLTANLTPAGKLIVIFAMFLGRLGPLTVLLGLTSHWRTVAYTYPREDILLG